MTYLSDWNGTCLPSGKMDKMKEPVKRNHDLFGGLIENFWNDPFSFKAPKFEQTMPAVNILDNQSEFIIELAAPGLKKEDFSLEVDDRFLKLEVNKSNEEEEKQGNYTRKEFSYYSFQRNFALPQSGIDLDAISANYEDGILKIKLPKTSKEKDLVKKIQVR